MRPGRGDAAPGEDTARPEPTLELRREDDGALIVVLGGAWRLTLDPPGPDEVERELDRAPAPRVTIDAGAIASWDTVLVTLVAAVSEACRARAVPVEARGLPKAAGHLLELVQRNEPSGAAAEAPAATGPVARVEQLGERALARGERVGEVVAFVGETTLALGGVVTRRARYRAEELWLLLQQCGAEALPIVLLVNFLLGIILGFVGITQLRLVGAETFVADIVGVAVVRDMAALITGVTLAGRSGGAFAADLAAMRTTQEIDALRTLGISPVEFLVAPRVLALTAMMPLLTLFADAAGVLGSATVGTTMLHLPVAGYLRRTALAVSAGDVLGGLVKATTYGLLIALTGTLRGMQADRTAARAGDAATRAVVTAIVAIIAACGVYQYVFFLFGW